MVAQNVENAWQFSKVYEDQVDEKLEPSSNWWTWAKEGFAEEEPKRFPMGLYLQFI